MQGSDLVGRRRAGARGLLWFGVVVAVFFAVRATTTLVAGADFGRPGTGWRSAWQLAVVVVLVAGVARPSWRQVTVGLVGVVYLGAAVVELGSPNDLFGVIPVDMRDHIVHPLIAVLALAALYASTRHAGSRARVTPAS